MKTLRQPGLPPSDIFSLPGAGVLNEIHSVPTHQAYKALATRPEGLAADEALERLGRLGRNVIQEIRGKPLLLRLLANFTHLMAILLWVGGLIGFLAGMPQLGVAIWMVNLINGAFSFWQEYKAEKAAEALRRLLPTYARVLREGAEVRIPAEELVPGDVLLLSEGDHVSADARLVQEAELRVDQSTLTGESHPVRKTCDAVGKGDFSRTGISNMVFAGTSVAAGTGVAVVFATGMQTEFGNIARLTQSVGEERSPLQKEMIRMTRVVTFLATGTGILFFGLAIAIAGMGTGESFLFAMGMIVAFVPEGLLPTVSLSLAMGVQRMARRNALVKRLSAVETLGCTTVICTDKTGTLTQNEMTVREIWVAGRRLTVTGVGYAPEGEILADGRPVSDSDAAAADLRPLLLAAGLCNNARLVPPEVPLASWSVLGDPTEAALRVAGIKGGLDLEAETKSRPRLRELPFDSRRKRMSTVHKSGVSRIAYVKGAPSEVLSLCVRLQVEGQEQPMTGEARDRIAAANDEFAHAGMRVLAVAARTLPDALAGHMPGEIESDLTFLGLMAMMDPPRPEVAEAVRKCHSAGIRVVMITGDYGLTAESVARRIGILRSPKPRLVNGPELEAMEDGALKEALGEEVLLARVTPEHKLRVVRLLREMGHVVAVTGDGVNDGPVVDMTMKSA
jgi:magnesium-transporting ATPase (P-type)